MIVAIDGPAGAGKSTVARMVAQELGFRFLDTGAMYRAIVYAALCQNIPLEAPETLSDFALRQKIRLDDDRVFLNDEEVTNSIRTPEIANAIHYVADNVQVRTCLSELQRQFARSVRNVVTEGRDQGTEVFPDAECKIYLTASATERARRRQEELAAQGERLTLDEILEQQNRRDERDRNRPVGRLRKAEDAVEICTDRLSTIEVVRRILDLVAERSTTSS